ncbi:MAG TPA: hypothetical protein VM677_31895 [Actinokineospora sp.]|nr:hypothetical protein [Actinokineospora sp.]
MTAPDDVRGDYGPAGCASGCARSCPLSCLLLALVPAVVAALTVVAVRARGGR